MKKIYLLFCLVFLFAAQSWGQTWNLTPTMTAVLDNNGVLTISTTQNAEAMPDYNGNAPWIAVSDSIHSVVIEDKITSIRNYSEFSHFYRKQCL